MNNKIKNNINTVALITARGGSKGIVNKNIQLLFGKPLIYWTIKAAINSDIYSKVIVSTDSKDIAKISFKEMYRLNLIAKEKESVWLAWMEENFPDVKKNDVLTGVYKPEEGITLHHNETVVTNFNDKDFARSFFLIWLHKNTSEPKLRQGLLEFREDG